MHAAAVFLLLFMWACVSRAQATPDSSKAAGESAAQYQTQAQTTEPAPSTAETKPQAQPGQTEDDVRQSQASTGKKQNSDSDDEDKGQQTKRMLWVMPNFGAVSANTELPPLSTKGKFHLAFEDSFDYTSFVWTGIISGQEFALKNFPEFGQGMKGYGRYYWRNFVDGASGTYFTEAIVPWISHQDPRYYTMEHGNPMVRIYYALSRVVLTKTDSGGTAFNWSELGGNALEAALANAYYPPEERGGRQTAINWAAQIESAALNNIAKEFWPDFRRYVLRRK